MYIASNGCTTRSMYRYTMLSNQRPDLAITQHHSMTQHHPMTQPHSMTQQSLDHRLRYAAKLVSGVIDYKAMIDNRNIPVDRARYKVKGQPLCMAQYGRLFTTYRVPGAVRDRLKSVISADGVTSTDSVLILRGGKVGRRKWNAPLTAPRANNAPL